MSTSVVHSSARSGFVLGLSSGLVIASAFFMIRGAMGPAAQTASAAASGTSSLSAASSLAGNAPHPAMPAASAMPSSPSSGGQAGSMEAATVALETRLATQGGSDEQWQLLAQSYDFLGRADAAKLAREHRLQKGGLTASMTAGAMLQSLGRPASGAMPAPMASTTPGAGASNDGATAVIARAEQHRRAREFKQACAAYAEAVKLGAMNADTWADYADAQASLTGTLAGEPEKAIAKSLALDPKHTKALWLKASVAHEQRRYKEALATWKQLLALVPAGSSDARIVQANIDEAARLGAG